MHLGVYPPNGRVRVAAPLGTSDERVKLFVLSKMRWIKKQQSEFLKQERQSKREFVSGETHFLLGRRYRLNVVNHKSKPLIQITRAAFIDLYATADVPTARRQAAFDDLYRSELRKLVPSLLEKFQPRLEAQVSEVRIKRMKTRWGTCNPTERRIWLNSELAKKSAFCIEYVFAHELVHLLERNHSERFRNILGAVMPQWQQARGELKDGVLGYSFWKCVTTTTPA